MKLIGPSAPVWIGVLAAAPVPEDPTDGLVDTVDIGDDPLTVYGGLRIAAYGGAALMVDTVSAPDIPGYEPYDGLRQAGSLSDIADITVSLVNEYTVPYTT